MIFKIGAPLGVLPFASISAWGVSALIHFLTLGKGPLSSFYTIIPSLTIYLEYFDIGRVKYKIKINIFLNIEVLSQIFFTACLQPKNCKNSA